MSIQLFRVRRPDGTVIDHEPQLTEAAAVSNAVGFDEVLRGSNRFGWLGVAIAQGYAIEPFLVAEIPSEETRSLAITALLRIATSARSISHLPGVQEWIDDVEKAAAELQRIWPKEGE